MTAQPSAGEPEGRFDAIVVGSGFGGAVMAYRLAEAGMSVCVLERGKAYPPGSFPRSPWEMGRNFWDPGAGLHGLFDVWTFRGLGGIVASGLGGGSLLWSNVVLRKDASTFVQEEGEFWPVSYDELVPYYERHEAMLKATPYPFDRAPYDRTYKTKAMQHGAGKAGLEWFLPPLAVTFDPGDGTPVPGEPIRGEEPNLHGRTRLTCLLCGECNIGCNFGAKNTLDYNYLTHAKHHGAELWTLCDVRTIEPREGGGYAVGYAALGEPDGIAEGNGRPAPLRTLTCDRLVLSAGTLGTANLLLRNRSAFPRISRKLGTRFCGNGDLLTLAINCADLADGVRVPRIVDPGYGPVITSTARMPDALDGGEGRGFYLQDAGYPQHLAWILHVLAAPKTLWNWRDHGWYLIKNWMRGSPDTDVTASSATTTSRPTGSRATRRRRSSGRSGSLS